MGIIKEIVLRLDGNGESLKAFSRGMTNFQTIAIET